jgi:hypothetical protein
VSPNVPNIARHAVDLVADPETGYAIAKSLDGSRKIEAKDCGQGMPGVRRLAHLDLGIEWIDAACSDPD